MALMRLDRFISNQTELTRSETREKLKSLCVTVNGKTEKMYDSKIDPETDAVAVDGIPVTYSKYIYLIMNKPTGVLTATEDKRQETVLDLLPAELRRRGLAPVGRLDKDTTGLLLLTDDGVTAHKIISPKSNTEKEYAVTLDGEVTDEHVEAFEKGVILADGAVCMPAKLLRTGRCTASVTVCEGKYHQIKRMFGTVGLGVNALRRVRIGALSLPKDLPAGGVIRLASFSECFRKL